MHKHDWPGNVRELVHALDYAAALAPEGNIGPEDLPVLIAAAASTVCKDVVELALRRNDWNVSATARELDLDRTTVHRRIRKLGLVSPNKEPDR